MQARVLGITVMHTAQNAIFEGIDSNSERRGISEHYTSRTKAQNVYCNITNIVTILAKQRMNLILLYFYSIIP